MIELIKGLIYIEIGTDSVLFRAKWLFVVAFALFGSWLVKRTLKSFKRRA